jgi:hypothetical protein
MVAGSDESWCELGQTLSDVLEVGRVWWRRDQLFHDGEKVVERGDRCQGCGVAGSSCSSCDGEQEGCVDGFEGDLAIKQGRREAPIGASGEAGRAGSASVQIEDAFGVASSV